ncbi:MAG: FKBP-type peptidyl-prolyl cis-trans isomerase [Bacteroidales bacterium]|nr:FKBP-type peptidyl-prolyl cis-trans isomerase [Bacteroidales bacterium]MBN2755538.1 FKBP-type peptidyl-prolyl cis-trans isomerase [Bacteroidales bacterium]
MFVFNEKIIKYFLIIILQLFLIQCNFSDFNEDSNGLYYKHLIENKDGLKPEFSDFVELKIKYADSKDSLLFDSKEIDGPFRVELKVENKNKLSIENAIMHLKVGERAIFKMPADSFYINSNQNLPEGIEELSLLTFDIELVRILSVDEIKIEREKYFAALKKAEDEIIEQYIADNNINIEPSISGLYKIIEKSGNGIEAKPGFRLRVNYVGKFINGEKFDSSYDRNTPFEFVLGKSEVIAAWEEGFVKMKEGTKAKFIIPSHLAYGEKGYGKIIPPFSSLIFEVELLKVIN